MIPVTPATNPMGWEVGHLGEVCAVNPRAGKAEYSGDIVVSFVPMVAVDERLGVITALKELSLAEVLKGYTSFEEGDILFAKITPCMENGKIALARNLTNGIGRGSTEFYVLRPSDRILSEYIYHFVRRAEFREEAKRSFSGTAGQQRVPKSFMENKLVPLPPLEKQRQFACIVNRAMRIITTAQTDTNTALLLESSLMSCLLEDGV